eukprot:6285880-Prymnesium_polylepis.1
MRKRVRICGLEAGGGSSVGTVVQQTHLLHLIGGRDVIGIFVVAVHRLVELHDRRPRPRASASVAPALRRHFDQWDSGGGLVALKPRKIGAVSAIPTHLPIVRAE